MKKILFLITTLEGGGAEKILLEIVQNISKKKYDVEVKCIVDRGIYINRIPKHVKYSYVFKDVKCKNLLIKRIYLSFILRLLKIIPSTVQHKIFIRKKYDVEIAFLEGAPTKLIAGTKRKIKKIAWVHTDPVLFPYSKKAYISANQEKKAYHSYETICCVSSSVKDSLDKKYHTEEFSKVQLNVLNEKKIIEKSKEDIDNFMFDNNLHNFISIGRLAKEKNYKLLLDVVKELYDNSLKFNLYIIGDGLEKVKLQKFIVNNGLEKNVKLLGYKTNPFPYIKRSELFICSSLVEGFSTAVCEALILEKPVLTTNCPGMKDIFGESKCGIIVENSYAGLFNGLLNILNNPKLLTELSKGATERSKFFTLNNRIKELEELL